MFLISVRSSVEVTTIFLNEFEKRKHFLKRSLKPCQAFFSIYFMPSFFEWIPTEFPFIDYSTTADEIEVEQIEAIGKIKAPETPSSIV